MHGGKRALDMAQQYIIRCHLGSIIFFSNKLSLNKIRAVRSRGLSDHDALVADFVY